MSVLQEIALLLDGSGRYWTVAFLALILTLAAALAPTMAVPTGTGGRLARPIRILARPGVFLLAVGLALLAMRWPLLYIPFALNPDESQGIAQAITILFDPVFYRSVQSGSAGPLWTYPIVLPALLGLDLNYGTTRLMGVLILWSTLVPLYFSVRLISGEYAGRLVTLIGLFCFGLPVTRDFLHYSSEYPVLPLLGFACFLFLRYMRSPEEKPARHLYLLGLALGAVPYAKLQGAIIALAIAVFAGVSVLLDRKTALTIRIRRIAAFVGGGLTVPLFFSLLFLAFGVFGYFWTVYIENNLHYKERGTPFFKIILDYMTTPIGYEPVPFVYKTLVVTGFVFTFLRLAMWLRKPARSDHPWLPLAFASLVFAVSVYAVAAPGRHFPHYLHLVVAPLCLLCGIFMHELPAPAKETKPPSRGLTSSGLLATAFLLLPFLSLLLHPLLFGPEAASYPGVEQLKTFAGATPKYPCEIINAHKRPGDHLSVWGWHADYYVDTQLPMGTRSAVTEFHIRDVPLRDYYRRHYLDEFRKRKPAFFIDAVGPLSHEFQDRKLHGHEVFPELAAYIETNYVDATDERARESVRFYIRKDRAAEIGVRDGALGTP